jgi:hypothetical protein
MNRLGGLGYEIVSVYTEMMLKFPGRFVDSNYYSFELNRDIKYFI